jgi:hypothetical protein
MSNACYIVVMPWLTQSTYVQTPSSDVWENVSASHSVHWLEYGRPSLMICGDKPQQGQVLQVQLHFGLYRLTWDVQVVLLNDTVMELMLVGDGPLDQFHSHHRLVPQSKGTILRESVEFSTSETAIADVLREAVWMHPLRWLDRSRRSTQVISSVRQHTA